MIELTKLAVSKGAKIYSNVSGGKDGQAMTKALLNNGFPVHGLVHADLGRIEWTESLEQCRKLSKWHNIPLHIVTRADGRELLDQWKHRMEQTRGTGKPFWSSSSNRYCTSDMKRDPINRFYNSTGNDFIISCEGIRAEESTARAKKSPLEIRQRVTSYFYEGMTVEEAIANYAPGRKLVLTYYPIFNWSISNVWDSYGNTQSELEGFRLQFKETGQVNDNWNFHPAYVYGNERVSCVICILGSQNDIANGAAHRPDIQQIIGQMEVDGGFTFKKDFSINTMSKITKPKN